MKPEHIQMIYEAKRTIVINRARIIQYIQKQDHLSAATLQKENDEIKKKILHKFGVILE